MKALICGSFNPPTNAHMDMGRAAQDVLGKGTDVIYIPTGDQYIRKWKGYDPGDRMPAHVRLRLLEEACRRYDFQVSSIEVDEDDKARTYGKTYNTVKHFGFEDSVLCLGLDNIEQMRKWYKWEDLLRRTRLLVFGREGYEVTEEADAVLAKARRVDYATLWEGNAKTSSTLVRRLFREGKMDEVKRLVPDCVYRYMEENVNVYF